MFRENFDRNWSFTLEEPTGTPQPPTGRAVNLPHDWSIELERRPDAPGSFAAGYFQGGTATYEKMFFAPEEWRDRAVLLEFEGVYMDAQVFLNNDLICRHPNGYTGFHADLTRSIRIGRENRVRVAVNNAAQPNSRWYSGSGIYRHVWLLTAGRVHIRPWGVCVTTLRADEQASQIRVLTTVGNRRDRNAAVRVRSTVLGADGCAVRVCETPLTVPAGSQAEAYQNIAVAPALLWSDADPKLYTLRSELIDDGQTVDSADTVFGIRTVSFDAVGGFRLNGRTVKLRGGCMHHDNGPLGACAHDDAEIRKIALLKAAGFNAIRCAHNPPAPVLLDACDRLGVLVIDEAFDCWNRQKNAFDYSRSFADWWERDLDSMVLRDRNHPSVILWSTGNEIEERDGSSDGYRWSRTLAERVRSLDPSRGVTAALNGLLPEDPALYATIAGLGSEPVDAGAKDASEILMDSVSGNDDFARRTEEFAASLDSVGYNYLIGRYERDGGRFPDRVIYGSETWAGEIAASWALVERLPWVVGDFTWAAWDYLGEAGIGHVWYNGDKNSIFGTWPWHQAWCGDFDICGFRRPQSYYREIVWGLRGEPYIAVHKPQFRGKNACVSLWGWPDVVNSWTWPGFEGKPVDIDVYSDLDEIELRLNGKAVGRQPAGRANRYEAHFEAAYAPGELLAVGYRDGREVSRSVLSTAGEPASLRLTADRTEPNMGGGLAFIVCEIVDAAGQRVPTARHCVTVTVEGAGALAGLGTGDPVTTENYTGPDRTAHEGRLLAVARASGEPGEIVVKAFAAGLKPAGIRLIVNASCNQRSDDCGSGRT